MVLWFFSHFHLELIETNVLIQNRVPLILSATMCDGLHKSMKISKSFKPPSDRFRVQGRLACAVYADRCSLSHICCLLWELISYIILVACACLTNKSLIGYNSNRTNQLVILADEAYFTLMPLHFINILYMLHVTYTCCICACCICQCMN